MADFSITGDVRLNSDPAEQSVNKWTVAAGQMIADFAKKAADALLSVVKSGLSYNRDMESYLTNFKVMLGDEQLAAEKLEEIRKMAASTPFTLSDLTEGTQTLLQFGIAADDTTNVLQMLGDISLGNADKMQTLVRAYGKMSSAQKVTLENVNMMIDAGFNPLNQICEATGESMADLYKRISDGKVGFEELQAAVEAATSEGGQFYNGMLEASQTFNGRLSTLTDNTKALLGALSDSFYSSLSDLLPVANDVVLELTDAFTEGGVPAMLDTAAELLDNFADGLIQKIPDAVSAVSDLLTELLNYLADHQDDIFDSGIQLLEQLIIGITDNLPQLITAAAELIAKFSAALISHLPDLLNCGAALLTTLVDGILRSIENLGEAALACIAKLTGVWDGSMDDWGHIGENIVTGLLNGITGMWDTLVSTVKGKVNGMVSTVKNVLGIHSPSKVFTEIGENVTQGLVNGINTGAPAAQEAIQNIAQTLNDYGPDFATVGATITEQFRTKLTEGWAQIQSDIQTDALGAIETLATALKNGDLEQLGLWAASYFWQACTKEQQAQINSIALGALNQLGSALSGVFGNLSQLAMGLVAQFVPAAASATAGQTALNVAMDANPILLVISLIGMLVGALLNFSGKNKDVANAFQNVWAGVEDFMSYIFEGLMRIVAAGIEGFVILINGLIGAYNSVAWLYGGTIDYISNPAWDYANKIAADRKARQAERKKQQEAINNPSSSGNSGTSTNSQKVIESMTDTSKTTGADGSTVTIKVLTEKLQDETGKITQRVTKTVTEAGTKLVDGVERSYKTVTTYVDGIQTKVERSLDDITKTTTGANTGSTTPTAPTPDKDLTDAVEANTEALLAANSKLAEMVRQADSLVLSDNMAISRSVAASGTAQVAAAANNYHREGDTTVNQYIYSKAQTAADLQREARWEADRAKAQKR